MHGGTMTYEMGITIIWAILVYVFYKIGKQEEAMMWIELMKFQGLLKRLEFQLQLPWLSGQVAGG